MTGNTDDSKNGDVDHLAEIFEEVNDGDSVVVDEQQDSSPRESESDGSDLRNVFEDGLDDALAGAESGKPGA